MSERVYRCTGCNAEIVGLEEAWEHVQNEHNTVNDLAYVRTINDDES